MANLQVFHAPEINKTVALVQMDGRDFSHILSGHNKKVVDQTLVDILMQKKITNNDAGLYYGTEIPLQFTNFQSDKRRTIHTAMEMMGKVRSAVGPSLSFGMNILERAKFLKRFETLAPTYQMSDTATDTVFIGVFDVSDTGLLRCNSTLSANVASTFNQIIKPERLLGMLNAWPLKFSSTKNLAGEYHPDDAPIKVHHGLEVNDFVSVFEERPRGLKALLQRIKGKTQPTNMQTQKFILTTMFEALEEFAFTNQKMFIKASGGQYFRNFFPDVLGYEPLESLRNTGANHIKSYCKHLIKLALPLLVILPFLESRKNV